MGMGLASEGHWCSSPGLGDSAIHCMLVRSGTRSDIRLHFFFPALLHLIRVHQTHPLLPTLLPSPPPSHPPPPSSSSTSSSSPPLHGHSEVSPTTSSRARTGPRVAMTTKATSTACRQLRAVLSQGLSLFILVGCICKVKLCKFVSH